MELKLVVKIMGVKTGREKYGKFKTGRKNSGN